MGALAALSVVRRMRTPRRRRSNVAAVVLACTLAACGGDSEADVALLFIGNQQIATNDLDDVFEAFAAQGGHDVAVRAVTPEQHRLQDHVESRDTIRTLRQGEWDYVVLQEQSVVPGLRIERTGSMYPAVNTLSREAAVYGAEPLLMMTWGWDRDLESAGFRDYTHMQSAVAAGYRTAADAAGLSLAPVGVAWSRARTAGISLYQEDGRLPNEAGTYLAAAVLYATIFDEDPREVAYDADLSPVLARSLRQFAGEIAYDDRQEWIAGDE